VLRTGGRSSGRLVGRDFDFSFPDSAEQKEAYASASALSMMRRRVEVRFE
jgi:hypothetical protein